MTIALVVLGIVAVAAVGGWLAGAEDPTTANHRWPRGNAGVADPNDPALDEETTGC